MNDFDFLTCRVFRIALDYRQISTNSYSIHRIPYVTEKELHDAVDYHRSEHPAWYAFDVLSDPDSTNLQYVDYESLEKLKIV